LPTLLDTTSARMYHAINPMMNSVSFID
jgi:hypothetical protein